MQRVRRASVAVGAESVATIGTGLLVLVGITHGDDASTAAAMARKIHGLRILRVIAYLVKEERPLTFFGAAAAVLVALSLIFGISVTFEFMETGLVPRLPTAVLSMGLMISALLSLTVGLILDGLARLRRQTDHRRSLANLSCAVACRLAVAPNRSLFQTSREP